MRTTFDIPEKLLADAKKLSGAKTKNRAVVTAIEDFVRRKKIEKLFDRAVAGEFKFDNVDFDRLRHDR
jgi:Arc/MetJ family transcription regulator